MQRGKWVAVALVAAWSAALALAQSEQQRPNPSYSERSSQVQTERQSAEKGYRSEQGAECGAHARGDVKACTPEQIADLTSQMKNSLADAIRTAEEKTQGKAVSAYCRFAPAGTGKMEGARSAGQTSAQRTGKMGEPYAGKTEGYETGTSLERVQACVVTVCTPDKKLVEVTVNNMDNRVLSQREIPHLQNFAFFGPNESTGEYAQEETYGGMRGMTAQPHRWQKGSDVLHKEVKNDSNQVLGRVENLAIDSDNGRIIYAVLSAGGVLGIGDKFFAIPWDAFDLPDNAQYFILAVDKEQMKNAQGFDKDHWPATADEHWLSMVNKAGQTGYRTRGEQTEMYETAATWQKATDLIGKPVKNDNNQNLGKIEDLAIDPDNGRLLYGIVSYEGKYVAVPWTALSLPEGAKNFVLNISPDRMTDSSVAFTRNNWPDLTDRAYVQQTYPYFGQRPYWEMTPGERTR